MVVSNETALSLARLEEWAKHSEVAQQRAEQDRKEMMKRLEEIAAIQTRLVEDMEKVKPVTDMVDSLKAKITGALVVLGIIGAVIWTGITYFQEAIVKWITG